MLANEVVVPVTSWKKRNYYSAPFRTSRNFCRVTSTTASGYCVCCYKYSPTPPIHTRSVLERARRQIMVWLPKHVRNISVSFIVFGNCDPVLPPGVHSVFSCVLVGLSLKQSSPLPPSPPLKSTTCFVRWTKKIGISTFRCMLKIFQRIFLRFAVPSLISLPRNKCSPRSGFLPKGKVAGTVLRQQDR